jgi:exopolysaccharide biosynthesis polyprenyl glycosylphosphotransferase
MAVMWASSPLLDAVDVGLVLGQAFVLSASCIVAFYYNDLYDLRVVRSMRGVASRLVQAFGVAFILLATFYTLFPDMRIAGGAFVSSLLIIVGVLLPLRALTYAIMRSGLFTQRVLIVGATPLALKIIYETTAQPHLGYDVVGVADDGDAPGGATIQFPVPVRGPLEHLDKIIEEVRPDRIIVALSERRGRLPVHQLLEAQRHGIVAEDGVQIYERLSRKVAIESLTPSQLIFSEDFKTSRLELMISRAISVAVAIVALIAFAPLIGLIAIAVKLDSPGPVFFVQSRVGRHGRSFTLIKFRTMRPRDGGTSEWARDNTARITRVGTWLREFRLDELPQFVNILRGDLNLVGPRPHPVSNYESFMEHIPYYALRTVARPGVTGWAQVRYGYANNLEEEIEKMRYDLYYIKHLSPALDLRILFDTVKIVVFGRGAQ